MITAIKGPKPKQPNPSQDMPLINTIESKKVRVAKIVSQKADFCCFDLTSRYFLFFSLESVTIMLKPNGKIVATDGTTYFCNTYWTQGDGEKL